MFICLPCLYFCCNWPKSTKQFRRPWGLGAQRRMNRWGELVKEFKSQQGVCKDHLADVEPAGDLLTISSPANGWLSNPPLKRKMFYIGNSLLLPEKISLVRRLKKITKKGEMAMDLVVLVDNGNRKWRGQDGLCSWLRILRLLRLTTHWFSGCRATWKTLTKLHRNRPRPWLFASQTKARWDASSAKLRRRIKLSSVLADAVQLPLGSDPKQRGTKLMCKYGCHFIFTFLCLFLYL